MTSPTTSTCWRIWWPATPAPDAGRADVMFVIQRVLEVSGRLTLLDQNKVIRPHPAFRLFATANTVGLVECSR